MILKNKNRITREAPYPQGKGLDSKFNFVFSEKLSDWMTSKQLGSKAAYKNAKPLF